MKINLGIIYLIYVFQNQTDADFIKVYLNITYLISSYVSMCKKNLDDK